MKDSGSQSKLKAVARTVLPLRWRSAIRRWLVSRTLKRLRAKAPALPYGSLVRCMGYSLRITDGMNFYMQFKDEYLQRIYHFEAERPDPLILDCGSNIGMATLYFKHVYHRARIIAFEPDPAIFGLLEQNVAENRLADVELINAAIGGRSENRDFVADGGAGGRFGMGMNTIPVRTVQLSSHLMQPVDFIKLNIEGEELAVLEEAALSGRLQNVRELVLEYHGWAAGPQRLGAILDLLDHRGFGT